MWDIEEWTLKQFEISITFDIQSIHLGKYKNREIFNFFFNLIALILTQFCFHVNIFITNVHALKNAILDRRFTEKYLLLKNNVDMRNIKVTRRIYTCM